MQATFFSGWAKFLLRNLTNIQTDKWQTAYYGTKVGFVRTILDQGQPLKKGLKVGFNKLFFNFIVVGQEQWGNLTAANTGDLQIVFHPSIQSCTTIGHRLEETKEVRAAFQLLVKPGAYSVSRDGSEWSTKESGAIALHALLMQVRPI